MVEATKGPLAVMPLGNHTAIGYLQASQKFKDVAYLKDNLGKIPPFIIAVGSRVRVLKAPELLGLIDPIIVDAEAQRIFGPDYMGRVSIAVGLYQKQGFTVPLCLFETQMGCSATQINLKEAMFYARKEGYERDGANVISDGVYVIRAGTAAGVNSHSKGEERVGIGDILIATETYGSIGAVLQSIVGQIHYLPDVRDQITTLRRALMHDRIVDLSHDEQSFRTMCSTRVVLHLQRAADALGARNFVGPNFSKDSLYGELGEDGFAALRDNYGVLSSEMEQAVVDSLAGEFRRAGISAHSGLVSAAIGAIPGKSFPETDEEKGKAKAAEENAVKIAADALWSIAKGLNS